MPVKGIPVCEICRRGRPRFQVRVLSSGRVANVCSVKCLLSWCLGFSLDGVQGVVQKLLKGMPK
jgi:hypothetical protein